MVSRPEVITSRLLSRLPVLPDAACRKYPLDMAVLWNGKCEDDLRPPSQVAGDTAQAKHICRTECPVVQECLQWAIQEGISTGIWGGYNYDERRAIIRRAKLERAVASA